LDSKNGFSKDLEWVFHWTFPEKEKLIDIGFLTVGFSKEFG